MFSSAIAQHERRKRGLQATQEAEAGAAVALCPHLSDSLVQLANVDVARIYDLQLQIEAESRGVRAEAEALRRNLGAVGAEVRRLSEGLKELGDFEGYVSAVEARLERVVSALLREPPSGAAGGAEAPRPDQKPGTEPPVQPLEGPSQGLNTDSWSGAMGSPLEPAALERIAEAIRVHARRHAQLQRCGARLLYDMCAVLCAVRPAFLLDYGGGLGPGAVEALAAEAATAAGLPVALMWLDGCALLGRVDALSHHLAALAVLSPGAPVEVEGGLRGPPRCCLVAFREEAPAGAAVLTREEAQAVWAALAPLHRALQGCGSQPAPGAAAGAGARGLSVLRLDDMPGLPLQPTLQASYPVVYDIRSTEHAAAASRCLSTRGLALQRCVAPPGPALAAAVAGLAGLAEAAEGGGGGGGRRKWGGGAGGGRVQGPERDLETLCAFSLPLQLGREEGAEGEVEGVGVEGGLRAAVAAWHQRTAGRLDAAGWWQGCRLEVEERIGAGVVL
ncbi:hypothetical protein HYH03_008127 [Edaphochlamys debaryana]|uniref:Biogenesis of lysosome-related organelles complex 1 subunit 1 n=1 Tax=Edaphochlamys debaryana TaxID=47281 RepID=A0A835Y710_9CHLO|nr:hypothetical protein HYH03_008127 [Edaphochlamys debaryana]|eukprot:KAG2493610.1 hypothetical protein HYH03_008127 [Edaphochlamys debaryana]